MTSCVGIAMIVIAVTLWVVAYYFANSPGLASFVLCLTLGSGSLIAFVAGSMSIAEAFWMWMGRGW